MKFKILTALALTGFSLFLVGCSGKSNETPLRTEYETLIGTFKDLGSVKVDKSLTHLFEDEEGEIYYAYSERYDLGDETTFNQRVEAYGAVMEYESMDKLVFEVRRISEAPDEAVEASEVYTFEYTDSDLGFSINYPDNWTFTALRDSVQLEAPIPEDAEEDFAPDYIIVARTDAVLQVSEEGTNEDRANEIRSYVNSRYDLLRSLQGKIALIGPDALLGVHYKQSTGEASYFVPHHEDLFEISFYHPTQETGDKVSNANTFSSIVASFRFLDALSSDEDQSSESEAESKPESPTTSVEKNTVEQVKVTQYHEFTSNPFGFSMSYPSQWYYSGGTGGYDFNTSPIEDDEEAIIRLDLNTGRGAGRTQSGNTVALTVVVDGKSYTLSAPKEYEEIMQTMADSITPTLNEE